VIRATWLTLVVILSSALNAFSQPPQPIPTGMRFFVSLGGIADMDNTWGHPTPTAMALFASAGVDVSAHVGVRFAVDLPKTHTTQSESSYGFFRTAITERHRSVCWSALADVHGQLAHRVRLGVVAGITAAQRPQEYSTSSDELGAGDVVLEHVDSRRTDIFTWPGVTLGAEVPVSLTTRLALVPEVSATEFPPAEYGRTTISRAGVSLRWQF
jgi:hypothetical protein